MSEKLNEHEQIEKRIHEKIRVDLQAPEGLYEKIGALGGSRVEVTEGRIMRNYEGLKESISFFRSYPDIFLEQFADPNEKFSFYFYQRVFLRAAMRHRYVYATFPRAYSKSFLAIMVLYSRCMLYPNSKLFIVSGGKEQSAKIAKEKLDEIWKFFPALKNELIWEKGPQGTKIQNDYINLRFKNGSYLDIVAAQQSSRGGRRTSGLIEESAQVDGEILSDVIIPMMNVSRRAAFGSEDPNDITNKSQIYVTTAGDKGTFPYDKLVQFYLWSLVRPDEAICFGGTWRVPVAYGLLDKDFVQDLKDDGTFSELTFAREYNSIWGGAREESFFSSERFDQARVLEEALWEAPRNPKKGEKIILGYDVGRTMDQSSCIVMRVSPVPGGGSPMKDIVNMHNFDNMHFEEQAIEIKRLFLQYGADKLVIDGNGLGIGLIDFMTISNTHAETGEVFPPFGVDPETDPKGTYRGKYDMPNGIDKALYIIKATDSNNSSMYTYTSAQLESGKLRFLIDDQLKSAKLKRGVHWSTWDEQRRVRELIPFKLTRILKEEMMNLTKAGTGANIKLVKMSSGMKKDMFSALGYALMYARTLETKSRKMVDDLGKMNLSTSGRTPNSAGNHHRGRRASLSRRRGSLSRRT